MSARSRAAGSLEHAQERHGQETPKVRRAKPQRKRFFWLPSFSVHAAARERSSWPRPPSGLQLDLNYFALDPHLTFSTRKQTAAPVVCDRQASPAATAAAHGPQPRAPSRCAKLKPPQWHLSRRCKICATVAIGGSRRRCGGLSLAHGATAAACAGQAGREGLGCGAVR